MFKRIGTILACAMFVIMGSSLSIAGDITSRGMSQKDLVTFLTNTTTMSNEVKDDYDLLRRQILNRSFGNAGIAVSTTVINIATAFDYTVNGVFYTKAITGEVALTANTAQAASTYRLYLLSIDSAGTVTCTQGAATTTDVAVLPACPTPTTQTPFGYFKIQTGAGGTFTSGTTTLVTSATVTSTLYNVTTVNSGSTASTAIGTSDLSLIGL